MVANGIGRSISRCVARGVAMPSSIGGGADLAATTTYADYSTGLAATSAGEYFAAEDSTGERKFVYLHTDSDTGRMVGVYPSDANSTVAAARATIQGLTLPGTPEFDFDSIEVFYGLREYQNYASNAYDATLNVIGCDNGNIGGKVGALTLTKRQPDAVGGNAGRRLEIPASSASRPEFLIASQTIPPGEWVLKCEARVTGGTGADQDFVFGANRFTDITTATATTAWQTFTTPAFELTSSTARSISFGSGDHPTYPTVNALDIEVCNIRIMPAGAETDGTDLSSDSPVIAGDADALNVAGMVLDADASGSGYDYNQVEARFRTSAVASSWTYAACINLDDLTDDSYIFSASGLDGLRTIYQSTETQTLNWLWCNAGLSNSGMHVQGVGWVVLTVTFDGTDYLAYINGVQIFEGGGARDFDAFTDLTFNSTTKPFYGSTSSQCFWRSALTAAQVETVSSTLSSRLVAKGLSLATFNTILIAEGDSITNGSGDGNYGGFAKRASELLTTRLQCINNSVNGSTLDAATSLTGRQAALETLIGDLTTDGFSVIIPLLIGTNDAGNITTQGEAETYYTDLIAYIADLQAAGAQVIIGSQVPVDDSPTADAYDRTTVVISGSIIPATDGSYDGLRDYIRALLIADDTVYDGLADYGGNAAFDVYSGTYFADGAHPNSAGHYIMAGILQTAIEAL